jgi:hypothetical protein
VKDTPTQCLLFSPHTYDASTDISINRHTNTRIPSLISWYHVNCITGHYEVKTILPATLTMDSTVREIRQEL